MFNNVNLMFANPDYRFGLIDPLMQDVVACNKKMVKLGVDVGPVDEYKVHIIFDDEIKPSNPDVAASGMMLRTPWEFVMSRDTYVKMVHETDKEDKIFIQGYTLFMNNARLYEIDGLKKMDPSKLITQIVQTIARCKIDVSNQYPTAMAFLIRDITRWIIDGNDPLDFDLPCLHCKNCKYSNDKRYCMNGWNAIPGNWSAARIARMFRGSVEVSGVSLTTEECLPEVTCDGKRYEMI